MRISVLLRLLILGSFPLIIISAFSAFAAGVSVPSSNVGRESFPVTAEDLKPPACNALYLTNIISGSGILTGTTANDLIIGGAGADTIDGLGGDDCILGGNGDDSIIGGDGTDICLGGAGTDIFASCESENQ